VTESWHVYGWVISYIWMRMRLSASSKIIWYSKKEEERERACVRARDRGKGNTHMREREGNRAYERDCAREWGREREKERPFKFSQKKLVFPQKKRLLSTYNIFLAISNIHKREREKERPQLREEKVREETRGGGGSRREVDAVTLARSLIHSVECF